MLLYSNLVEKVKKGKVENLKESYLFRLNFFKFLPHIVILGVSFALMPFLYVIYKEEGLGPFVFLVPLLAIISIYQIVNRFKYKFEIKNGSLFYKTVEIKLEEVTYCALNYGVLPKGKKLEPFLDIVTINKEEKIIPLNMGNKLMFILVLKELVGNRFSIVEEK